METVRFRGWLIDSDNYQKYLIEGFRSHNLIVILHALSSELVETYNMLLSNIQDPFMRFVEFNLRSTLYRNIVLSIEVSLSLEQEKFSFAFEVYDKIYGKTYHPPPVIPKYSFWRSSLSVWSQKMSDYHKSNRKIYDYITAKLRENSLLGYLSTKIERLPSVYRYGATHAASSGMKPSSTASVKFSRTRHIKRHKAVFSLKASSKTMKKFIKCQPRITLNIQLICP